MMEGQTMTEEKTERQQNGFMAETAPEEKTKTMA